MATQRMKKGKRVKASSEADAEQAVKRTMMTLRLWHHSGEVYCGYSKMLLVPVKGGAAEQIVAILMKEWLGGAATALGSGRVWEIVDEEFTDWRRFAAFGVAGTPKVMREVVPEIEKDVARVVGKRPAAMEDEAA